MRIETLCAGTALAAMLAMPSYAQQLSPWYTGLKAGTMDIDAPGFDNAANIGLFLGYTIHQDTSGRLAIEGEYTTTMSDGDAPGGGAWDIDTLAIYGAYRTEGPVFLKAKAGYLSEDVNVTGSASAVGVSDSGFSFGAGGGIRLGKKAAFEIEYTVIEDDVNFLSLAYLTHF